MRPFTKTIPFADALAMVMRTAKPVARQERVALAEAGGRVAAADVRAAADVPPFARAAMDGYAVIAVDTTGASSDSPRTLVCVGRVFAGQNATGSIGPGCCIEIATGAPMPPGADAVLIVEETSRDGDTIVVRGAVAAGQNIGRQGTDIAAGAAVVHRDDVLTPGRIGALAAAGLTHVDVFARPSVAVVSTGDELVAPGRPLAAGQIYEVNRYTIAAVVTRHGATARALASSADDLDRLGASLDAVLTDDVIVFSGGSSVGDRDLVRTLLDERGTMLFHGIAVRPGKPTAFATVNGTPVFGMPGNPTSCLSNAYMLLVPFVRALAHLPPWRPTQVTLPLARRIASVADRHQFYTVKIENGRAQPAFKGSGDITSMADADGYIEIPIGTDALEEGTSVVVTCFE